MDTVLELARSEEKNSELHRRDSPLVSLLGSGLFTPCSKAAGAEVNLPAPTLVKKSDGKGVRRFILDDQWNERSRRRRTPTAKGAVMVIARSMFFLD